MGRIYRGRNKNRAYLSSEMPNGKMKKKKGRFCSILISSSIAGYQKPDAGLITFLTSYLISRQLQYLNGYQLSKNLDIRLIHAFLQSWRAWRNRISMTWSLGIQQPQSRGASSTPPSRQSQYTGRLHCPGGITLMMTLNLWILQVVYDLWSDWFFRPGHDAWFYCTFEKF